MNKELTTQMVELRRVLKRRLNHVMKAEALFPGFMKNAGYEVTTPLFSDVALEAQVPICVERTRSERCGVEGFYE